MSTVTLRPIGQEDGGILLRIYRSTREEELALTQWSEEQKHEFVVQQFASQHHEYSRVYPDGQFQLILVDGLPAGRLYLGRIENQLRIIDIALLPEFRGQGIGGRLISDVIRHGESIGLPVSIHVERFNPAMRLYERLGFRPVLDRGVYLLMQRDLPAPRSAHPETAAAQTTR